MAALPCAPKGKTICLSRFQQRQDIPRRILEPRDRRPIPARNPGRVCLQVGFVIDFKSDAALAQFIHSFFYAVYGQKPLAGDKLRYHIIDVVLS